MSYLPSISTLAQIAESHVPVPIIVAYGFMGTLFSAFPPAIGGAGIMTILIYQIASMLKKTKHEASTPATLIKHCVTSFLGLYVVTFLIVAPIHVKALLNLQDHLTAERAKAGSLANTYLPRQNLESLKKSIKEKMFSHNGIQTEKADPAGNPAKPEANPAPAEKSRMEKLLEHLPHHDNETEHPIP